MVQKQQRTCRAFSKGCRKKGLQVRCCFRTISTENASANYTAACKLRFGNLHPGTSATASCGCSSRIAGAEESCLGGRVAERSHLCAHLCRGALDFAGNLQAGLRAAAEVFRQPGEWPLFVETLLPGLQLPRCNAARQPEGTGLSALDGAELQEVP